MRRIGWHRSGSAAAANLRASPKERLKVNRKRSGYWLPILVAALAIVWWVGRGRFRRWSLAQLRRVRRGSHRARTVHGVVEYQRVGEGHVILLVHGAPGGSDSWRMVAPLLERGFSVLSPSRPGYLGTPLRSGRTFAQQADLLAALLDTLKISSVFVVGHSMGGPVALEFAQRHPEKLTRLVLLSAITHPSAVADVVEETVTGTSWLPRQFQSLLFWVSHRFLHYLPSIAVRTAVWTSYTGADSQKCIDTILASPSQRRLLRAAFDGGVPLHHRQRGYDNDVQQLRRLKAKSLANIHTSTLILHSRNDASVPFSHAAYAAAQLPEVHLEVVDGCGHLLFVGPDAHAHLQTLTAFLSDALD